MQNLFLLISFVSLCFSTHIFGETKSEEFNITSFNLRNFWSKRGPSTSLKKEKIFSFIKKKQSHLLAIQELKTPETFRKQLTEKFPFYELITSSCGGLGQQYLGIIYDKRLFSFIKKEEISEMSLQKNCHYGLRPALVLTLKENYNSTLIQIINLHLKAGSDDKAQVKREKQVKYLSLWLTKNNNLPHIILGDFNMTEEMFFSKLNDQFINLVNATQTIKCSSYWWGGINDRLFYPSKIDHILFHNFSPLSYQSKTFAHCQQNFCFPSNEMQLGSSYTHVSDHCPINTKIKLEKRIIP